jgi:hypothetical protein
VESSCELGNEPSGSIKFWESTEWLHNLWPLEWYSARQSYLVTYFWGVELSRCVKLTNLPPSVSPLSRQCEIHNISQPCSSPLPVTKIALRPVTEID